jgi:gamma-glutamyl-gamma-aminobutyrate hydrolase PuuD
VGGYPVVDYIQNDDGHMVMTLAQVSKNTVEALEQTIDGMVMTGSENSKGRLHYRLRNMGYDVSILSEIPHSL